MQRLLQNNIWIVTWTRVQDAPSAAVPYCDKVIVVLQRELGCPQLLKLRGWFRAGIEANSLVLNADRVRSCGPTNLDNVLGAGSDEDWALYIEQ